MPSIIGQRHQSAVRCPCLVIRQTLEVGLHWKVTQDLNSGGSQRGKVYPSLEKSFRLYEMQKPVVILQRLTCLITVSQYYNRYQQEQQALSQRAGAV